MAEDQSTVTYSAVPDFPGYRVGDDGSVWSCRVRTSAGFHKGSRGVLSDKWHQLRPRLTRHGYPAVSLCREGATVTRKVHTLVLLAFVGPAPKGHECCHADGTRTNNRLSNLRWGTRKANKADSVQHGTVARGKRHGMSKLSDDSVRAMRADYEAGERGFRKLGRKYGVTENAARLAVLRQTWRHVS